MSFTCRVSSMCASRVHIPRGLNYVCATYRHPESLCSTVHVGTTLHTKLTFHVLNRLIVHSFSAYALALAIHETTHEYLLSLHDIRMYMLRKFWKLFIFFFFFSSSKLQREQHNAWTRGLHHSIYVPEMFPGSLKGCV